MAETKIEWAEVVWNPTRGCSRKSPGCGGGTPGPKKGGCYAERMAGRFSGPGQPYEGLVEKTKAGYRWTGKVVVDPVKLAEPLRWRKPRRVFVDSMSDLFHEKLTNEEIAAVVGIMAACPDHIFISLTKRAKRQREWGEWMAPMAFESRSAMCMNHAAASGVSWEALGALRNPAPPWPLPNWWAGVSAEDQQRWDERVPELLRTPAAVRVVSVEPLLSPVYASPLWMNTDPSPSFAHWLLIGGESGPGAGPFHFEWMADLVEQCRVAGVAAFCKQGGSNAYWQGKPWRMKDKKGGDPEEWPPGDWPREFPGATGR